MDMCGAVKVNVKNRIRKDLETVCGGPSLAEGFGFRGTETSGNHFKCLSRYYDLYLDVSPKPLVLAHR